ncbi:MAG: hypothetical protein U9O87_10140 [Verrucomicrobiota bacterium]|nr:hypothetical protein [Verrucomicrobiota bacterium]
MIVSYIDWLFSKTKELGEDAKNLPLLEIQDIVNELDDINWSFFTRAYFERYLVSTSPKIMVKSNCLRAPTVIIVEIFSCFRMKNCGCFLFIPFLIGLAFLSSWGLDKLLGTPKMFPILDNILFVIWILSGIYTSESGIAEIESYKKQFFKGCLYLGSFIILIVASIWIRLN